MCEQPRGQEHTRSALGTSWIDWAVRHPGLVLLGTLVVAVLAITGSPKPAEMELDADGEEVPLFI